MAAFRAGPGNKQTTKTKSKPKHSKTHQIFLLLSPAEEFTFPQSYYFQNGVSLGDFPINVQLILCAVMRLSLGSDQIWEIKEEKKPQIINSPLCWTFFRFWHASSICYCLFLESLCSLCILSSFSYYYCKLKDTVSLLHLGYYQNHFTQL